MSGEKPIVTRTLALLGAFFFAATLFAFWGFRFSGHRQVGSSKLIRITIQFKTCSGRSGTEA